jgi:hypothetical protein
VIAGEGLARASLARQAREPGLGAAVRFIGYLDRSTDLPKLPDDAPQRRQLRAHAESWAS